MRAYLIRHFDGARCPAAVVYDLSATAAHQQYAVLPGATFATTTVERAPVWDGHAPDGPTLAEVLARLADAEAELLRLRELGTLRAYTDAAITEALRESGGRISGAARALGCSRTVIVERIRVRPEVRPPGLPKFGPGRPQGRSKVAEIDEARERRAEEAQRAVEDHGTPAAAARALGVTRQTIANRLAWVRKEAA